MQHMTLTCRLKRGDNKCIHKLAKRACDIKDKHIKVVKLKNGKLTTSTHQFAERFPEHFRDVFNARVVAQRVDIDVRQPLLPSLDPSLEPDVARVRQAINDLHRGKAVGFDGIIAEVLHAGGDACALKLWELLKKIWHFSYWPLDWRGG